jgi:hypothetical protein
LYAAVTLSPTSHEFIAVMARRSRSTHIKLSSRNF